MSDSKKPKNNPKNPISTEEKNMPEDIKRLLSRFPIASTTFQPIDGCSKLGPIADQITVSLAATKQYIEAAGKAFEIEEIDAESKKELSHWPEVDTVPYKGIFTPAFYQSNPSTDDDGDEYGATVMTMDKIEEIAWLLFSEEEKKELVIEDNKIYLEVTPCPEYPDIDWDRTPDLTQLDEFEHAEELAYWEKKHSYSPYGETTKTLVIENATDMWKEVAVYLNKKADKLMTNDYHYQDWILDNFPNPQSFYYYEDLEQIAEEKDYTPKAKTIIENYMKEEHSLYCKGIFMKVSLLETLNLYYSSVVEIFNEGPTKEKVKEQIEELEEYYNGPGALVRFCMQVFKEKREEEVIQERISDFDLGPDDIPF